MAAAIVDWPKLMEQAFKFTKPGGYAEFQDFELTYYSEDGSMGPERAVAKWASTLLKACDDFGRTPNPGSKLEGWLKDAGYQGVTAQKYRIPIGPWAKDKHLVRFAMNLDACSDVDQQDEDAYTWLRNKSVAGTLSKSKKVSRLSPYAYTRSSWVGRLRRCTSCWRTLGRIFEIRRCMLN